jgi:hypothetical protein
MISSVDPEGAGKAIEDKCRHCGEHLGYAMPGWEVLMLGCCDKPECRKKEEEQRRESN